VSWLLFWWRQGERLTTLFCSCRCLCCFRIVQVAWRVRTSVARLYFIDTMVVIDL
jgi:hypothetical protein